MTGETMTIEDRLSAIFANGMHVSVPSRDAELLDSGVLDSLGVIELLMLIEQEFGITVAPDDLELDNFRSISAIAELVRERTGANADRCASTG
ncbi:MAG TPA: acyl carrier protein [Gemmatimonadaceae bacterium]